MVLHPFRNSTIFAILVVFLCLLTGQVHAQSVTGAVSFTYRCQVANVFQPGGNAGWSAMTEAALFIPPKTRCWIRLSVQQPLPQAQLADYYIFQRSPLIDIVLFDAQGGEIVKASHDGSSRNAIEIGRRLMLPLTRLNDGPLYVRIDSSNPTFQERVVNKGFSSLAPGVKAQQGILITTIFAAIVLLTSAMFTAAFGVALRDLGFGIFSLYTFALAVTLVAWDQVSLPLIGINYGWIWQLSNPISISMLCWLAIRFGKFHLHSLWISRALIVVMAFNLMLFFWALLSLVGVPLMPMPFERFEFENWQDVVMDVLILLGGWRGYRRGEQDCLMLVLSLTPSLVSDVVNRFWDPLMAPLLHDTLGLVLPEWLNSTIHFNGSLSWMSLPLVFCFVLARRSMLLHMTLLDERKRLEDRVLHRTHELHVANKELELLATTDSLTGLGNRRSMLDWIRHEIERSARSHKPLALCMIDVDHFKKINDTHGHLSGDRAIIAIARTCNETIRKIDMAARFGGEEFVILMPETDLNEARFATERLRAAIEALSIFSESHQPFSMTISIGVAFFDNHCADDTMTKLLNRADKALYQAKVAGRNQVVFHDGDAIVTPAEEFVVF